MSGVGRLEEGETVSREVRGRKRRGLKRRRRKGHYANQLSAKKFAREGDWSFASGGGDGNGRGKERNIKREDKRIIRARDNTIIS